MGRKSGTLDTILGCCYQRTRRRSFAELWRSYFWNGRICRKMVESLLLRTKKLYLWKINESLTPTKKLAVTYEKIWDSCYCSRRFKKVFWTLRHNIGLAWLGGNDIEKEGTWKWTDCTPWDYTFWASSEPNNLGRDEDCLTQLASPAQFGNYLHWKWNDENCSDKFAFLCSKRIC